MENNGTAFLLNCGKGPFLVTAAHVYESYCDRLSEGIEIWPQLSNITFQMEERLIGYLGSETLDIVTFRISSGEIKLINRRILEGSRTPWTAPIAMQNEGALFLASLAFKEQMNQRTSVGSVFLLR